MVKVQGYTPIAQADIILVWLERAICTTDSEVKISIIINIIIIAYSKALFS